MPEQYYDLGYSGAQINDAIGRMLSGEIETAVTQAQQYAENAEAAGANAVIASEEAQTASQQIQNMTVEAETVPAETSASVEKTISEEGVVNLKLLIPKGADGPKGNDGDAGKSAYQQAVEGGYTGTEEEFNAILASGPWLPTDGGVVTGDVKISGDNSGVVFDGASVKLGLSANNLAVVTEDSTRGNPIYQPLQVASPIGNNDAATKKYVDDSVANAGGSDVIQGSSVVIGPNASSENLGHPSVVIGYEAKDTFGDGISIGFRATTNGYGAIALGSYAVAQESNSISIGHSAIGCYTGSVAIGHGCSSSGSYSTALGGEAKAYSAESIAIGHVASTGSYPGSIAIGGNCNSSGVYSTALGGLVKAVGNYSIAIGHDSRTLGLCSVAIGSYAIANWDDAIAIGQATNSMRNSIALGREAISGSYSVAIGCYSTCHAEKSVALGAESYVSSAELNMIQLGAVNLSSLQCSVSLSVTSDIRDKAEVEPIENGAIELLEKITPISYFRNPRTAYIDTENLSETDAENRRKFGLCEYDRDAHAAGEKKGSRRRVGVSAQAVQKALEEVYGSSSYANIVNDNLYDVDPKDIPDGVENQLTVNYEGLIPFLIKAVQELSARVKELEEIQK